MSIFSSFRVSASGLTAQRLRLDTISSNIANAETTRTAEGGPYRRQQVVFQPLLQETAPARIRFGRPATSAAGVQVTALLADEAPARLVFDPNHPDADADGMVAYPNVDPVVEMTDLMAATRAYEANVTAFNAAKQMAAKALDLGRG